MNGRPAGRGGPGQRTSPAAGSARRPSSAAASTSWRPRPRRDRARHRAYDSSGRQLWATPIAKAYDFRGNVWSLGPNSTPSVDGHFLYALGSQGVFVCVDDTGKEKWRVDLVKSLHGRVNPVTGEGLGWGYNWSPLVAGDRVIIAPGGDDGLLAALDKATGAVVWRSKEVADECTYSSPVLTEIGGVPQIVYTAQTKVYGVAARRRPVAVVLREEAASGGDRRGDAAHQGRTSAGVRFGRWVGGVQGHEDWPGVRGDDRLVRQAVRQPARRHGADRRLCVRRRREAGVEVLCLRHGERGVGVASAGRRLGRGRGRHACIA